MGRGRILNRKEMRADFDAAERRKTDDEETDEVEEEEEDEGEEEEAAETEEEASEEDEEEEGEGDEDDEEKPKKRKPAKVKVKKVKAPAKPRSRAAKVTRMKVIWGVFSNSNQRVAVFDYPKRKEAEELAAKLTADKKNTHFVQPVKEPMEEK